eukprot:TRINITY_DN12688_c0_g2_i1.p1 TRINITY_DN12688_c0_g2~~TRINITY_DN12688_c0_g2_i1.p1  ORF type:complete len:356 (-),score=77.94 TRINITY_DN12688_c0_g2_i1:69-1088(-)
MAAMALGSPEAAAAAAGAFAAQAAAPAFVDHVDAETGSGWRFFRTDVERAEQVTNGKAWIQTFEHVLQKLPRPRRTLGVSLSDSGDPRHTMPAFGAKQRNDAVKAMRDPAATPGLPEGARRGVGQQLRLPSGHEVLLICNVGSRSPAELPRKFREMPLESLSFLAVAAKCPHMGGCLNEGELKDVEDLVPPSRVLAGEAPGRRAVLRCPWHNMQFDLETGQGVGNHLELQRFPVRVAFGAVYIGVPAEDAGAGAASANVAAACAPENGPLQPLAGAKQSAAEDESESMDVDMDVCKTEVLTPASPLDPLMAALFATPGQEAMRRRSRSPRVLRATNTLG